MTETNEDISCSWVGRPSTVNIFTIPKVTYRFNAIPIKLQWHFSQKQEKISTSEYVQINPKKEE